MFGGDQRLAPSKARFGSDRRVASRPRRAARSDSGVNAKRFSEDELVERPAVALLAELGWDTVNAHEERLGPGGTLGRDSRRDVVLGHRLLETLRSLNPDAPAAALEEAATAVSRDRAAMDPTRANS